MQDAQTERISLPLPPEAFRPQAATPSPIATTAANLTDAVRSAAAHGSDRNALERAVDMFDLGIALRAEHRYMEALEAWEQALELAPDNLVYQANVKRLRAQLGDALRE
jgi:tetratricopeptide (TPR) repeat protein